MDEMARRRMALELLAAQQAASMRDPSLRRNAAPGQGSMSNAGPAIPGLMGSQSGPGPDPFSQVPGGGSTANALPPANPLVDDRRYYTDMADSARGQGSLGLGAGLLTMMMASPNPASLAAALGLGAYGGIQGIREAYGTDKARRLGYQGN